MSSLPITFALFALSAAENASVNRNKNLIAGSHRINNSGEEIIQYKRGGQMAVAPHGVLKENSQHTEDCKGTNCGWMKLFLFCGSQESTGEPYARTQPATQPPEACPPATPLQPGGFKLTPPNPNPTLPAIFLRDEKLPTSFNIPRLAVAPISTKYPDPWATIVEPRRFKTKRGSVGGSADEVELVELIKADGESYAEFVYLPYFAGKITCIDMTGVYGKLAVLSDLFSGCWMTTISEGGVLQKVCHVGVVDKDDSANGVWNKYVAEHQDKQYSGFQPFSTTKDIYGDIVDFMKDLNKSPVKPISNIHGWKTDGCARNFVACSDIIGLVTAGEMYTLGVPRASGGLGSDAGIPDPTSYLLRQRSDELSGGIIP